MPLSAALAEQIVLPPQPAARVKTVAIADLFCGAGSLSTGANDAMLELGLRPHFTAVNHWKVATDTYSRNHPGAAVHCVTLDAAFPSQLVPKGKLDLLMAGIECTFFSRARGGKPMTDQQRMSAWHVVRWCTELRVKRLLLENVPEFLRWGPVDPRTGRAIKSREGEYFRAWWAALEAIGFKLQHRVLNCADFGDATTRERLFIMGRSDGKPIVWPTPSHRKGGGDLFGAKPWRAAREIIDWAIAGRSIFDRKKPLAPKTLIRIAAGIVKFRWPEPFIVVLRQHCDARGIDLPLPVITAGGTHLGLARPIVLANRNNNVPKDAAVDPMPCATTAHGGGIAVVEPFIANMAHGAPAGRRDPDSHRSRSLDDPVPTIHAGGGSLGVVEPFVFPVNQGEGRARGLRSVNDPVQTIVTGPSLGIVRPIDPWILNQQAGGTPRSVGEPVPAIATDGAHALIAPYYGAGSGETCTPVGQPLPTVTTKDRFGLVVPVTHVDGGNRARSIDDPLATITTAARGELAFIAAQFGERDGQAPRVHSIDDPAPTVCATGHTNLVRAARDYDILFRMLEPHELAAAMSISEPGRPYHFTGNKTEVVRQIGQAVPRRTGRALALELMRS